MAAGPLPPERQQEVFAALIAAQDAGATPWDSWELVSREFGVPLAEVPGIEEAGTADRWWPPAYGTLNRYVFRVAPSELTS